MTNHIAFVIIYASAPKHSNEATCPRACKQIADSKKRQGSLGNVGIRRFVFTIFQVDNFGISSGDDEGNGVYNRTGREINQYKYCRQSWGQAYKNNLKKT